MGRTAVAIGGTHGIGHATVRATADDGHQAAITKCHSAPPPGLLPADSDVVNTVRVNAVITTVERELGPVNIAIIEAGVTHDQLLRMDEDFSVGVIDTNVTDARAWATKTASHERHRDRPSAANRDPSWGERRVDKQRAMCGRSQYDGNWVLRRHRKSV